MMDDRSFRGRLHRATHRISWVPPHAEQPAGHQGQVRHAVATRPSLNQRWNHSPARPPRVMAAWQRRITAFFGQKLR